MPRFGPNPQLQPDAVLQYQSPNADVIGWLIERVAGVPLQEFVRERIWTNAGRGA